MEQAGKTLYQSDFAKGTEDWTMAGGEWETRDGGLRQTAGGNNQLAFTGDPSWTDYTLKPYSLTILRLDTSD